MDKDEDSCGSCGQCGCDLSCTEGGCVRRNLKALAAVILLLAAAVAVSYIFS